MQPERPTEAIVGLADAEPCVLIPVSWYQARILSRMNRLEARLAQDLLTSLACHFHVVLDVETSPTASEKGTTTRTVLRC